MDKLLQQIRKCQVCKPDIEPRPVVQASKTSKIVIIGQAPGSRVHASGIPWDDPSGDNLRAWMDVDKEIFYDASQIALVPMGFCYPGKGRTGDLPPRSECAPLWHQPLLNHMKDVELILLVGQYAQNAYLGERAEKKLTDTVKNFREYLPEFIVLPHPSPRNNIWRKKNLWFDKDVVRELRRYVKRVL